MSTYVVQGQASDFSSDLEDLVESILSTHWNEYAEFNIFEFNRAEFNTGVDSSVIKFGNDWWDGNTDIQMHILRGVTTKSPAANNWKLYQFTTVIPIHIFIRSRDRPPAAQNVIEIEVDRIITKYKLELGQGVSVAAMPRFENVPEEDPQSDVWHSMGFIELRYMKRDTS